jgi:hypothetical protein
VRRVGIFVAVVSLTPALVRGAIAPSETGALTTRLALPNTSAPLTLGLDLYGNGWESPVTQSRIAGTEIRAEFARVLADDFTAQVGSSIIVEAGAARSRFTDEFRPRQGIRLREASLAWSPSDVVVLQAGALDQDRWDAPLLLRRQSFPGAYERLAWTLGAYTVAFEATQAMVNDTSTLQRWGNWAAGLPSFFFERVSAQWKRSERTRVAVHASHYAFKDLSHRQAYDAQFLGNSVLGFGPETATFRYGFQGFELGFRASAEVLSGVSPFLRGDVLWNGSAPEGRGVGWSVSAGLDWERGDRWRLRPSLELFRVESDVSPALFNTRNFGHTNRQGWAASLGIALPKSGLRGELQWVRSDVIAATPLQTGATWVGIQLSLDYDAI